LALSISKLWGPWRAALLWEEIVGLIKGRQGNTTTTTSTATTTTTSPTNTTTSSSNSSSNNNIIRSNDTSSSDDYDSSSTSHSVSTSSSTTTTTTPHHKESHHDYISALVSYAKALVDARDYSGAEGVLQSVLPHLEEEEEEEGCLLLGSALVSMGIIRAEQGKWFESAGTYKEDEDDKE